MLLGERVKLWMRTVLPQAGGGGPAGFLSPPRFRALLEKEVCRADRNPARFFSLALFEVGGAGKGERRIRTVQAAMAERLRCTDEIGWFDKNRIGLLMMDTGKEGAVAAAKAHRRNLRGIFPEPMRVQVYTYPFLPHFQKNEGGRNGSSRPGERKDFHDREGEPIDAAGSAAELLASGMPLWKRIMDVFLSAAILAALLPLLLAVYALVKIVSPGPALFKQTRIGYRGKPFVMWKFRTMKPNADPTAHRLYVESLIRGKRANASGAAMLKMDNRDGQIIPFGRFLRKSALDELPQLINVLRGEMSLVGPRPCLSYEYAQYEQWETGRLHALPGMTGLWQVNGKNRTTFHEMVCFDIRYARNRSLWNDVKILFKTVPAVVDQIRGQGSVEGRNESDTQTPRGWIERRGI